MSVTVDQTLAWCRALLETSPDFPPLEQCLEKISSLEGLADLPAGTRVLVRGDLDVAFTPQGALTDDSRLRALIETLRFGKERGWVQILYGHIGRKPELSLASVAPHLKRLLNEAGVACGELPLIRDWMDDATGEILDEAEAAVARGAPGDILLLENTRKYLLEQCLWKVKSDDLPKWGDKVAAYANGMRDKIARVHVNEGFAASNRDLSSTVVPLAMDRVALGRYIDHEIRTHLQRTRQAELVVFSGMKLEKLDDLQGILRRGQVKMVIAAGLLALALKKAEADLAGQPFGMGVCGESTSKIFVPPDRIEQARTMLVNARREGIEFVLPIDFVLCNGQPSDTIPDGGAQCDVGPKTIALHAAKVGEFIRFHQQKRQAGQGSAVVFHNGVFGKFEEEPFAHSTRKFLEQLKRMTDEGLMVYVGGGEGGAALHQYGQPEWVTHCFTAGGTILKALGTEPIPYLKALYLAAGR
ncbi:MAG: phosphoglycerate kinase [Planctomycetales bacterium]